MQLYILGPAFGVPSIDAQCAAAVALLWQRDVKDCRLIPTHDDRESLPLLVDGNRRVSGFKGIARHLETSSSTLEKAGGQDVADCIAISSFVETNAQTLLDISLYVSFGNYTVTRSAFTKILPWHMNYILPPKWRAAARTRTEHLGISSIDVDNVHEDLGGRPLGFDGIGEEQQGFEAGTQKRASLLLPRKETVRSMLQRPEHSAVFKLHALADEFFHPLEDMLGDKKYLVSRELSSVDCLAYGYLSLMLYPQLPHDWLASTIRRKYGKLVAYVERIHKQLGLQTSVEDVMALSKCNSEAEIAEYRKTHSMSLLWSAPATSSIADVAIVTGREALSHIPTLSGTAYIVSTKGNAKPFWQRYLPAILSLSAASLGLFMYTALRTGMLVWPHGEEVHIFGKKRFADYGHLGAALAGMFFLGQQATGDSAYYTQDDADKAVLIDVELEGDSTR